MPLAGTGAALGNAMRVAVDGVDPPTDRAALYAAMGDALATHWVLNGALAVQIPLAATGPTSIPGVVTSLGATEPVRVAVRAAMLAAAGDRGDAFRALGGAIIDSFLAQGVVLAAGATAGGATLFGSITAVGSGAALGAAQKAAVDAVPDKSDLDAVYDAWVGALQSFLVSTTIIVVPGGLAAGPGLPGTLV